MDGPARKTIEALDGRRVSRRVRAILDTKSLSLYSLAARSRLLHPGERAYHLPHNFYYQLQTNRWTPTIQQLVSLAETSDYRFLDWLRLLGFDPDAFAVMEATLPSPRTIVLDGRISTPRRYLPWFKDRQFRLTRNSVTPLARYLEPAGLLPAELLPFPTDNSRFLYAKIGREDAFAYPDLSPGSIVRANRELAHRYVGRPAGRDAAHIFLLEHSKGFCCSRLHFSPNKRVTLVPSQLPFSPVEFELGSQARILGIVDLELRPLTTTKGERDLVCSLPAMARDLVRTWAAGTLVPNSAARSSQLLRRARINSGLSLRAASAVTRTIAKEFNDERYFASEGSLSDYEALDRAPRHMHKLFSLSALYGLPLARLLDSYKIDINTGASPMPEGWISEMPELRGQMAASPARQGFLAEGLAQLNEVPYFAVGAIERLSGLPNVSLNDFFWVDSHLTATHPALSGAFLIVVNRRKTKPPTFLPKSIWDRRLYVIARRNEPYLLAACTTEENLIVAHIHTRNFVPNLRLRNRVDAEVIGQITAVVRSVESSINPLS